MTLNKIFVLGNFQFDDSIWRTMNFERPLRKKKAIKGYTQNCAQKPFTYTIMTLDCEERSEIIQLSQ